MLKILIPSLFAITLCASEVTQTSLPLDLEFAQKALQNKAYQDSLNRYIDIKKYYEDRNMVDDVVNIQSTILYIKKEMAAAKASKTTVPTTASGSATTASATTSYVLPEKIQKAKEIRDKNISDAKTKWKKSLEASLQVAQKSGNLDLVLGIKAKIDGKVDKKLEMPGAVVKADKDLEKVMEYENGKYKKVVENEISAMVRKGDLEGAGMLKGILEGGEKELKDNKEFVFSTGNIYGTWKWNEGKIVEIIDSKNIKMTRIDGSTVNGILINTNDKSFTIKWDNSVTHTIKYENKIFISYTSINEKYEVEKL